MKRIITLVLAVAILFMLTSCNKSTSLTTTTKETQTTRTIDKEYFDVNKYDLDQILPVFIERLGYLYNYKKETKGKTVAKKLITYTQNIDIEFTDSDGEGYLLSKTDSILKTTYLEAYFRKDNISYKKAESDEFADISYQEYLNMMGCLPYGAHIEGFEINNESIISFSKNEDGSYHLEIDGEKAGDKIKIQMKNEGELKELPSFSKVSFEITMLDDFSPVTIAYHAEYVVNVAILGETNCVCDYTVTYEYYEWGILWNKNIIMLEKLISLTV